MIYLLCGACVVLLLAACLLLAKVFCMRRAAQEISAQFAARLRSDTNVGIDISTGDSRMRLLAQNIDRECKNLRKAQLRYLRGDRELKEAVTNISHDLRTPLTAICGYIELLKQEDLTEPAQEYLRIIENRAEALRQLTEELFRYSLAASVEPYASREQLALNQALEECIAAYYGALKESGIEPEIFIPETPVVRKLNKAAVFRIFGNIITNAIKYSDGDLKIVLSEAGTITFSNRAARLDEVMTGRLFDRFYTVENGQNGTGLGLFIARALTEQMGGTIGALREPPFFSIEIRFPEKAEIQ